MPKTARISRFIVAIININYSEARTSLMKTVHGQKVLRRRQKLQGVVNITSESRETGPGLWKNFGEDLFSRTLTGVLHAFAVTFMFGLAI